MGSFLDVQSDRPVTEIQVSQGETKVVRLKKFSVGQPVAGRPGLSFKPEVVVACQDPSLAFCFQVSKLAKPKKAYDDKYDVNDIDTTTVEIGGFYCFQICGKKSGRTELTASFMNQPQNSGPYASSVSVVVTDNRKRLFLTPSVPFDTLWAKHPYINPNYIARSYDSGDSTPVYKKRNHPCPLPVHSQCMVRLCTALADAGVGLAGLSGWRCGGSGPKHKHHFVNPYDFVNWKGSSCYVWQATAPYQPEPMPGLAAWLFMMSRHGAVVFKNYFTNDGSPTGGHIDLWNGTRIGNNWSAGNPLLGEGLAAFFRSQKIYFWPLD